LCRERYFQKLLKLLNFSSN